MPRLTVHSHPEGDPEIWSKSRREITTCHEGNVVSRRNLKERIAQEKPTERSISSSQPESEGAGAIVHFVYVLGLRTFSFSFSIRETRAVFQGGTVAPYRCTARRWHISSIDICRMMSCYLMSASPSSPRAASSPFWNHPSSNCKVIRI